MTSRIWISLVFLLSACGGDEFSSSSGGEESDGAGSTGSDANGSDDGSGSGQDGSTEEPAAAPDWSGWEGVRVGPTLDKVDLTLGNYGQDLPEPDACPDLPETGCLTMMGEVDGESVEVSCDADSFGGDDKWISCSSDWGDFAFYLPVTGSPPSQFAIVAEYDQQFPLGLSWITAGFQTHDEDYAYLIKETHEQQGLRVSGVRYELVEEDDTRQSFISGTFAVKWLSRPSCSACPDVYMRGNFSAHVNP